MGNTRGTPSSQTPEASLHPPPLSLLPGPHHTLATVKAQFWILLLRMSLPLDSPSRRPLPLGGFLGPGRVQILVHFTL